MKKFLLSALLLFLFVAVNAQDIIVLPSGYEMEVKVEYVTDNDIVYLLWDDLQGMKYSITKTEVIAIRYADGHVQYFSNAEEGKKASKNRQPVQTTSPNNSNVQTVQSEKSWRERTQEEEARQAQIQEQKRLELEQEAQEMLKQREEEKKRAKQQERQTKKAQKKDLWNQSPDFRRVLFNGYFEAGLDFLSACTYGGSLTLGSRLKRYVYMGAEFGYFYSVNSIPYNLKYQVATTDRYTTKNTSFVTDYWYAPIAFNFRILAPMGTKGMQKRHYMYFTCSLGGYVGGGYYDDGYGVELMSYNQSDQSEFNSMYYSLSDITSNRLEESWQPISSGFYGRFGLGWDVDRFSFGAGYTCLTGDIYNHLVYVRLGVRFGKNQ